MKEKMYLVTDITFDTTDGGNREGEDLMTLEEERNLEEDARGLWYATDEYHLCDKITEKFGFGIIHINSTNDTLHPLTAYM